MSSLLLLPAVPRLSPNHNHAADGSCCVSLRRGAALPGIGLAHFKRAIEMDPKHDQVNASLQLLRFPWSPHCNCTLPLILTVALQAASTYYQAGKLLHEAGAPAEAEALYAQAVRERVWRTALQRPGYLAGGAAHQVRYLTAAAIQPAAVASAPLPARRGSSQAVCVARYSDSGHLLTTANRFPTFVVSIAQSAWPDVAAWPAVAAAVAGLESAAAGIAAELAAALAEVDGLTIPVRAPPGTPDQHTSLSKHPCRSPYPSC